MQTAAIAWRVADFLPQHPPFQFIDEADLLALAGRGRVRFHDSEEYVCWQGSPHSPFFFVIQQGSVSLWDETLEPPVLCDIRGVGDIIGIERFHGVQNSLHSAKTDTEVVVYALPAADLEPLLVRYPHAGEYVAAHAAVTSGYRAVDEQVLPHEMSLAELLDESPTICPASATVQEAAALLSSTGADALALGSAARVEALLTTGDLVRWIAAGAHNPAQPASAIADSGYLTLPADTRVSDCVLAMSSASAAAAILAPHSVVTSASLAPAFGDNPMLILDAIATARTLDTLRRLNARARGWLLANLSSPAAIPWLTGWADTLNRRILGRLLEITGHRDSATLCCFYGPAGRRELLTAAAPQLALIGNAIPGLEASLAACGYLAPEPSVAADMNEWKARFSAWICDPLETEVYEARAFFDLRPVCGPGEVFEALEAHVRTEVASHPVFLRVIANDCLASLPPLTFFQDLVVEESGEQTDTFHLEAGTLQPLADVARVLMLALAPGLGASTGERFQTARRCLPANEAVFQDAAETLRVALFHQARAGLRLKTSGADLPLSMLSRQDRQTLKSGFRAIHNLLKFTAPGNWLRPL